jgi:hypothetical protein
MEISKDVREAIVKLLQVCKQYQVRALSLNHALAQIVVTRDLAIDRIETWCREGRHDAETMTNEVAAELEKASVAAADKDFLEWLNAYPSMVATSAIAKSDFRS